ncbi:MAG: putative bifunctional diguanylate cyclase/phosphodiesterase, partial [Frankiaceae bacterium]
AKRMTSALRSGDTAARVGGDEFVVVAEDIDSAYAFALADRLRARVQQTLDIGGHQLLPSVSIGIAIAAGELPVRAGELLRDADSALYRAKERGRDRVEIFEEALRLQAVERLQVESELRAAVACGGLALHYQPIIDIAAGHVTGYEALLRWPRGPGTTWTPDRFLDIAEETGLVMSIGEWVLDRAVAFAAARPDSFVSVNLSVRQLYSPGLTERVRRVLANHAVHPHRLHLELVESALIGSGGSVLTTLRGLDELGVRLAVDDFGTGYSALSYLRDLPVGELKIDRSFVERLGLESDADRITEALIALGRALGLDVIAEGVETREQAEWLAQSHCPKAQGFYFGPPAPDVMWEASVN